ncbi:nuclear transport factor 2 family protein [Streptomyces sp. NBC_00237]|uniref:nuclear transport factor 2 family protein n=1 Tax=Streptomyces sp. NBC_00237 TaxID=2975687 RepID=UPI00225445C1|nr:nuclear transport factor 2 family protein [Streptomyces sp. NBC_00237]MCX5205164.1 nuclear transport factor 2 family protein [Streptomyces sp. NBC_00237]
MSPGGRGWRPRRGRSCLHANEQLVRDCLAAISRADAEGWLASYTDDAVSRDVPLDSAWNGRAGLEAGVRSWLAAIPDTRMDVRAVFAGDRPGFCELSLSRALADLGEAVEPGLAKAASRPDPAAAEHAAATRLLVENRRAALQEAAERSKRIADR